MHVVAFLSRHLLSHLRIVLGELHTLGVASETAELDSMLRVDDPDLLVVDPMAREGQLADELEEIIARHPSLPVVVYTTLTPHAMRLVVQFARVGVEHVVLNRFDDEPRRFLDLIERVPAHPMAELLLQELAEPLRQLPVVLARAIEQLVRSPSRAKNIPELAAMAGMTPRTLYRQLTPAGLPPRHLIACARLLRAYIFLRRPGSRLKEISLKLGYAEPQQLSEQLREWTGLAPKVIRRDVDPSEFVHLLVDHLRRADATEEDAVEPV